jgi:hypothetical protein
MLPDFLRLKQVLGPIIARSIQADSSNDPILSQITRHRIHEGDRFTLVRSDGSSETKDFQAMEASVEITAEEIRDTGLDAIGRAKAELAGQFKAAASKSLFETVMRATDEVGNNLDAGGRPLSAEMILEMFEKMEFGFSPDGTWRPPQIVVGPGMAERAAEEMRRLNSEPELKSRFDAMIERKREEWRVREADRKLVD